MFYPACGAARGRTAVNAKMYFADRATRPMNVIRHIETRATAPNGRDLAIGIWQDSDWIWTD